MRDLLSFVNPLQGTASEKDYSVGNTLPLLARPFGMHHWSLQTAKGPWLFHPAHQKVWGIRLTHQPSPWMGDYGSLLVTAFRGPAREEIEHQAGAYRLLECQPASLRYESLRYGLLVEMSPAERGALFVFTPQGDASEPLKVRLHFGGVHEIRGGAGENRFTGCSRDKTYATPEVFGLHFFGSFDVAPEAFTPLPDGGYWTFPASARRVELRLAGSFMSGEMARTAWARELRDRSLDTLRNEGAEVWTALLGRVDLGIPGTAEEERRARTFYSCLYRCLLFPRFLDEVDEAGAVVHYSPYDGGIHSGPLCTDNGFWDTHRTLYPLLVLLYPETLKRMLEGWLNACRQAGWSPKWANPGLCDCMIGTHYDAVVADAVANGITDWDVEGAFEFLWKNATVPSDSGRYGRRELDDYLRLGYVPSDRHLYAVSSTLDYAYDDFCVGQVARHLGRTAEAEQMARRAQNYRNVFDPSVGFMRERLADGSWKTPFREFSWGGGFVEGGPWQHLFNVPHDPEGLASLLGGPRALCAKLDRMMALPPTFEAGHYGFEIHEMTEMAQAGFGQYAQSNQPVHGFLFLYALNGEPEKTSRWVRAVATTLYTPETFPGDEDNGEMAAWYVWATLGLYPQCPGRKGHVHFEGLGGFGGSGGVGKIELPGIEIAKLHPV